MAGSAKRMVSRTRVPGGFGRSFEAAKGQYVCVLDVEGDQTCDFWAMDSRDFDHYLSPPYTVMHIWSLIPKVGDELVTNRRDPILTVVHDDVGWHDMLCPPCDRQRYLVHFGVTGHRNCYDNFLEAMAKYGWGSRPVPSPPFNIFMNTTVDLEGKVTIGKPRSKKGDKFIMRAEMDLVGVASACPMDLTPSGLEGITDLEIIVGTDLDALRAVVA